MEWIMDGYMWFFWPQYSRHSKGGRSPRCYAPLLRTVARQGAREWAQVALKHCRWNPDVQNGYSKGGDEHFTYLPLAPVCCGHQGWCNPRSDEFRLGSPLILPGEVQAVLLDRDQTLCKHIWIPSVRLSPNTERHPHTHEVFILF